MKTNSVFIALLLILSQTIEAVDNKMGILFFESGLFGASESYFQKEKSGLPAGLLPEASYYLGLSYFNASEKNEALALQSFNEGVTADETYPYNYVGLGMLALKTNKAEAESYFKKALGMKNYKKDASLRAAVAAAYLSAGMVDEAHKYIEQARSIDSKAPASYMVEGDLLLFQKQKGEACGKYETALYSNPDYIPAYLKLGAVYIPMNSKTALDKLKIAGQKDDAFPGTYCLLGDLFKYYGDYGKAVAAYARFIDAGYYDAGNLSDYAQVLYFDGKYNEALSLFQKLADQKKDDVAINRFNAYCQVKMASPQGLAAIRKFMETTAPANIIVQDYICYAEALVENNDYTEALNSYKKALDMEPERTALLKDIYPLYIKMNDPGNAVATSWAYLDKDKKYDPEEIFRMGKIFYNAGNDTLYTVENRMKLLANADSLFSLLAQKVPDSYLGYFWQARTNASLDPETTQNLAQPFYEKVAIMLEPKKADYSRELVECYKYLGYSCYLKGDNAMAKQYFDKVLQIDPDDAVAKEAQKGLK
ncbi:MAG: tetratricopeptide repeat protein [Bacteroidales bacterium]|nr:tetratricopeptide repeat protein [Bacteroidales bacterium]